MKRLILILIAVLITLSVGCIAYGGAGLPAADGKAVINYISNVDLYQNWQLWPDKGKLYKGQHPHGAFLTTYLNAAAFSAVQNKTGTLPDGAIVVKENYTPEKKLAAITVMYKKAGYNVEAGDYFWVKYAPEGTILKEGKVGGCINCHSTVKDNDWLFTGPIN
jgi:hypothetical protein